MCEFSIRLKIDSFVLFAGFFFSEELPPHLHGITFYGENIQDEWFIVELLFHLTKKFDGLIARVIDSDGEFMLIEAAEHLPQWANPDTCMQRVSLNAFRSDGRIEILSILFSVGICMRWRTFACTKFTVRFEYCVSCKRCIGKSPT